MFDLVKKYLYRYFAYTYMWSSAQVYRLVKPKELRELYAAYHTLDVGQSIERILETKNMLLDREQEIQRQLQIYKNVRLRVYDR